MLSPLDFILKAGEPGPSAIAFGQQHPYQRVRQALRGNHAVKLLFSKPAAVPKNRHSTRRFLYLAALAEVNTRNSVKAIRDGRECWFNIMPRSERRKLARAFAAGEWRRQQAA